MSAAQNSNFDDLYRQLEHGVKQLDLELSERQLTLLINYIELYNKWNKAYNLSAIRDINEQVSRHLIDSLSVVPVLKRHFSETGLKRFIDVGTGGGLPGMVLAIIFPEIDFTLLDSNGKKTRFLFQVKTELKLANVTVENRRVESFHPEPLFDGVISRAFASLKDMTDGCHTLVAEHGFFWAMKGIYPEDELSEMAKDYTVVNSFELHVPNCDGQRHLLQLEKCGSFAQ